MKKSSGLMAALQVAKQQTHVEPIEVKGGRGKKSDPRFRQISVLVEKEPYNELQRRVIGTHKDASDIINELLKGWIQGRFEV